MGPRPQEHTSGVLALPSVNYICSTMVMRICSFSGKATLEIPTKTRNGRMKERLMTICTVVNLTAKLNRCRRVTEDLSLHYTKVGKWKQRVERKQEAVNDNILCQWNETRKGTHRAVCGVLTLRNVQRTKWGVVGVSEIDQIVECHFNSLATLHVHSEEAHTFLKQARKPKWNICITWFADIMWPSSTTSSVLTHRSTFCADKTTWRATISPASSYSQSGPQMTEGCLHDQGQIIRILLPHLWCCIDCLLTVGCVTGNQKWTAEPPCRRSDIHFQQSTRLTKRRPSTHSLF